MILDKFDENGDWKLNPNYKEIARLRDMLEEAEIPHVYCRFMDGWQICIFKDDEIVIDAIEHAYSYGNKDDLLEVYGKGFDDPIGWIDAENAFELFKEAWMV